MRFWLFALVLVSTGWFGCADVETDLGPMTSTPPEAQESVVTRSDIALWTREGDWLVSPTSVAEDGATQVGFMLELTGKTLPPFESRLAGPDGSAITDWAEFSASWQEEGHFVGTTEHESLGHAAQVRIHVDALDAIVALHWNAVIPGETEAAEVAPDDANTRQFLLRSELSGKGIVTREQWGAQRTTCRSRNENKTKMAIHYTVTPSNNPEVRVRAIQRYHQNTRNWCDVGYHFLIGIDGTIYEGRPLEFLGSHVGGNNTGNIGISFVGCFHPSGCGSMGPTTPPEAMISAGGRLLGSLSELYGIPLHTNKVKGHRDHPGASTSCPGDHLKVRIDDMLAIGQRSTLGSAPDVVTPPQPPVAPGACGSMACGSCEAASGCDWCASGAGCGASADTCSWAGDVGRDACWSEFWPCAEASCWNPEVEFETCGSWQRYEDFSSGNYAMHRYWATLRPGGPVTFKMQRTAGGFAPALLIADRGGKLIYGGDAVSMHPQVRVTQVQNGRQGDLASVTLEVDADLKIYAYATGWSVIDSKFAGGLGRDASYKLTANQNCSPNVPNPPADTCQALACGSCQGSATCSWCGSQGTCQGPTSTCEWAGKVGASACWPALWPCAVGSCWNPQVDLTHCGAWTLNEDFGSGSYSVHRYRANVSEDGPLTLRLERLRGDFQPSLIVADRTGRVIVAGEDTALHRDFTVTSTSSGRFGDSAETTIHAHTTQDVYMYVTDWRVLDAGFSGEVSRDTRYQLSTLQDCSGGVAPPTLATDYAGLTVSGSEIPRKGLMNGTLQSVLGMWEEPYGDVVDYQGNRYVRGTVSWFGGSTDQGVSATETGAITGENLRTLNTPANPSAADLAADPGAFYYAAMRWNYSPNGREFWKNARLLVVNPANGKRIVVRAVDWGPNTSTSRVIDLSPQALQDLGISTDDDVLVAFAPDSSPLGMLP